MKHLSIALLLIAFISSYTHSQKGPGIRAGFINGNDYLELDANEKRPYAMGAIDGLLVAPLLGAPEAQLKMAPRLHTPNERWTGGRNHYQVSS
jgi:hypothetical protein